MLTLRRPLLAVIDGDSNMIGVVGVDEISDDVANLFLYLMTIAVARAL